MNENIFCVFSCIFKRKPHALSVLQKDEKFKKSPFVKGEKGIFVGAGLVPAHYGKILTMESITSIQKELNQKGAGHRKLRPICCVRHRFSDAHLHKVNSAPQVSSSKNLPQSAGCFNANPPHKPPPCIEKNATHTPYPILFTYLGIEQVARIDQRPLWIKIGDSYLRADKTNNKVHLDWILYSGSENFRVYYTVNDFTFTNPDVLTETGNKYYDHDVLNDSNNYAYRIFKNVPTEGLYFYHCDHLMTPLQMTDENQNVIWQAEYYPFGKIYSQNAEIENNLRFPGQLAEKNLNFYSNWHRYYSAKIGRYFSGVNYLYLDEEGSYDYVLSNPVNKYDFDGNKIKPIGDVANEIYNRFKKCNKLFKGLAEQFEEDKKHIK